MAWMKTGTVSVENGSPVIIGAGTAWFGALQAGWGFVGPDGRTYEVLSVQSATQLTLASNYMGATAVAQSYSAFPTQSLAADLTASLQALISNYQTIHDKAGQGRFPGDVVFDADRDTGMGNPTSNEVGLKAGDTWQLRLKGSQASGSAVQSDWLDAAVGKLLKPGAFGWGHDASNGSANGVTGPLSAINVSGVYRYSDDNHDAPSLAGMLLHFNRVPTSEFGGRFQLALGHSGQIYSRVQNGSDPVTYEAWSQVTSTHGSNANGSWVRLPNGTQICTAQAVYTSATADVTWTYPAEFYYPASPGRPAVSGAISSLVASPAFLSIGGIAGNGSVATDVAIRAMDLNGNRVNLAAGLIAIGRWK